MARELLGLLHILVDVQAYGLNKSEILECKGSVRYRAIADLEDERAVSSGALNSRKKPLIGPFLGGATFLTDP